MVAYTSTEIVHPLFHRFVSLIALPAQTSIGARSGSVETVGSGPCDQVENKLSDPMAAEVVNLPSPSCVVVHNDDFHLWQKYLVFGGKTGWIGIQLVEMLKEQGKDVTAAASRIENLSAISEVHIRIEKV